MTAAGDSEERVQLMNYSNIAIENQKYGQDLERYTAVILYFLYLGTHSASVTEFENCSRMKLED